jgi:hypothetical protein
LLLATWNIREFGSSKKYGERLNESIQYIAEIINHFDLVAVQEVRENLADLKRLIQVLGNWWEYIVTDVVAGRSGNTERIAFLYDTRKVRFDHVAGEVTLPDGKTIVRQLARTPFLCRERGRVVSYVAYISLLRLGQGCGSAATEIQRLSEFLAGKNTRRQRDDNGEPE